ncbi:MAG: transcriptional repressor [Deltaproteobacteria bacterium]|nr:transcriptional repressor [Deltaproteobacteria bacterium]
MCQRCNYTEMLNDRGIDPTPNRIKIMEVIGNNPAPIAARDILATLKRTDTINRVTVYRILDLLVEKGLIDRLSSGGRRLVYGLSPNENHPPHPHFQCKSCGALQCLQPDSISMNIEDIQRTFAGEIQNVEIRISGICRNCIRSRQAMKHKTDKK